MTDEDPAERWARAVQVTCPAPDDLLLAAADLLGTPGAAATRTALDDQSRLLFDSSATRLACAERLTAALALDLGYVSHHRERPELLSLPQVVATRTGHPLLLAVVAVALLRRAGHAATVCHADGRWLAAACGSPLIVIDIDPGVRPDHVHPVCGHVVGVAVLSALELALARDGRSGPAAACEALIGDLPVVTPPR